MTAPFYLSVAIAAPIPKLFDYKPESGQDMSRYQAGLRVSVPFGSRFLVGVINDIHQSPQIDPAKLKPIAQLLDHKPLLPVDIYQLGHWMSTYYHQPLGECMALLWPVLLRKGGEPKGSTEIFCSPNLLTDEQFASLKRAPRQLDLHEYLLKHGGQWQKDLVQAGFTPSIINGLNDKGFLEKHDKASFQAIKGKCSQTSLILNSEQQQAITHIKDTNGFKAFLIDGVTGSGKTEVYLQAIATHLEAGNQVLILVPEIGLTPQTVQRFAKRFDADILLMHSKLNDRERLDAWLMASAHDASQDPKRGQIVIGTRSSIFTPMPNLAMIIVDEEHDQSFKQQDGVRYHGRDIAVMRAKTLNIPILMGSATPSLECLHNALAGKYHHIRLTQRAGDACMPELQFLNIKNQAVHHALADSLLEPIAQTLEKGQQVLVFVNRRGYAPTLYCPDCAWIAECKRCDAKMTLHQKPAHLHCHHCDSKLSIPRNCPECLSTQIQAMGAGTERLENHLINSFSHVPTIRIDRDSTQNKNSMEALLEPVHKGEPCIIVGTQMLAKGHHFPKVTLVIMVNVDSGFFSADYRAMEKTAQLILQVAGRAGREKDSGTAVIQTEFSDHPMLHLLKDENYHALSLAILDERKLQHLPPYGYQILVRSDCHQPKEAEMFLHRVRQLLNQHQQFLHLPNISMIGPLPAPMELRAGRFRSQLWISAHNRKVLHHFMKIVLKDIYEIKGFHKVRWSLDIDPTDNM